MAQIVASDIKHFSHLDSDLAKTLCELLSKNNDNGKILSVGEVLKTLIDVYLVSINTPMNIENYIKNQTIKYLNTIDNLDDLDNIISIITQKIISPINPCTQQEFNCFTKAFIENEFLNEMRAFHCLFLSNPTQEATLKHINECAANIMENILKLYDISQKLCMIEQKKKELEEKEAELKAEYEAAGLVLK
jgi:hypothetical protein